MKPTFAINCLSSQTVLKKSLVHIEKLNLYFISHIDRRGKEKTLHTENQQYDTTTLFNS